MDKLTLPLFSIITVSLNSQESISGTLDSIRDQDYKEIELIIVDGASTDKTLNIIEDYKKSYQKDSIPLHLISEPDTGIYNAMNKGIDASNGRFIIFMNSDDTFYSSDVLSSVAYKCEQNALSDNTADIIYGGIEQILYKFNNRYRNYIKSSDINFNNLNKLMCIPHQACFFNTQFIKNEQFNERFKIAADYDLLLRGYKAGVIFDCVDNLIASKKITINDASSDPIRNTVEFIKILSQYNKVLSRNMIFHYKRLVIYIYRNLKEKLYPVEYMKKKTIQRMKSAGYMPFDDSDKII